MGLICCPFLFAMPIPSLLMTSAATVAAPCWRAPAAKCRAYGPAAPRSWPVRTAPPRRGGSRQHAPHRPKYSSTCAATWGASPAPSPALPALPLSLVRRAAAGPLREDRAQLPQAGHALGDPVHAGVRVPREPVLQERAQHKPGRAHAEMNAPSHGAFGQRPGSRACADVLRYVRPCARNERTREKTSASRAPQNAPAARCSSITR